MPVVAIPIIGPTYTNRSLPVGSQVTRNFYVEVNQQGGEIVSFMPFPGLKPFAVAGTGKARGRGTLNGVLYKISGTELFSVTSSGATTLIGTIPGSNRCVLEEDSAGNLVITNGAGKPFSYDGSTLVQGSDNDLPNASTVTYINDRVIYESATGLSFSDLNAPLIVNSANVLKANTIADTVEAVISHRQQVITFNSKSIEPNYFVGTGNPPYARVNNAVQQVGTSAKYSVTSNNNFIYFLDNHRQPSRMSGLSVQSIGNPAIGQEIEGYSDVSDCFTVPFNFDGQEFCLFSFPSGGSSFLFSEASSTWTNLSFGTSPQGEQHLISDYINIYGKHLVSDRRNGNIYELDFETFTDNGETIQRRRDTANVNGKTFGFPGRTIFMNSLELVIEPGASLVTEESSMSMEYSDDNGRTFHSADSVRLVGEQGDYTYKLKWHGLGSFYNRMFRFTMTDPIKWVLISAHADIEVGLD